MVAQVTANSLIAASIYALVAVGFSVIYGTVRFFHIAHGAVYTAGAYLAHTFIILLGRKAMVLSGGERQILSLARTMMLRPKALILGEPSAGLSPNYVKVLFNNLREIAGEGVGVLIVEQNAHAALKYSDRGYVLRHGKIVTSAPASELLKQEDIFKLL